MEEDWIRIGSVRSVNPARRQLRVTPESGCVAAFEGMESVRAVSCDGQMVRWRVAAVDVASSGVILELAPGVTRDSVAGMKGAAIVLTREEWHARSGGVYVVTDLVGMAVVDTEGGRVGVVLDAFTTPAHDIVEVERQGGGRLFLPVVDEVVVQVDLGKGVLVVGEIAPYAVYDED